MNWIILTRYLLAIGHGKTAMYDEQLAFGLGIPWRFGCAVTQDLERAQDLMVRWEVWLRCHTLYAKHC